MAKDVYYAVILQKISKLYILFYLYSYTCLAIIVITYVFEYIIMYYQGILFFYAKSVKSVLCQK